MDNDLMQFFLVCKARDDVLGAINNALEAYENHCVFLKHLSRLIDKRHASGNLDMDYLHKTADMIEFDKNYIRERLDSLKAEMEEIEQEEVV